MAWLTRSIILSCGLLGFTITLAQAQSILFTKEQFTIDKDGLKLAQHELELGDHEFGADPARFGAALPHYLRAQKFNPKNALLNAKIGECYLHSATKQEALGYLQRAQQLDAKAEPRMHYLLARALHLNGQWEAAIKEYEQARPVSAEATSDDVAVTTDDLARCVRECHRGLQMQAHPVRVKLENAGPAVNSAMSDYAPLISADESVLLLTSRRAGSTGGQLDTEGDGMLEDIYQSDWTGSAWGPARNLGAPVNTARHDATVGLSADGQHLLVYMEDNEGDIYESDLVGNAWSKPRNLGARLNTRFHESAACYSPDGKYLYFVSDRPEGNRGGRDIYRLELDARTPAENLGPVVNSPYDEEGVFMHPDGKTLYFSSKGHDSMGGYDIFKSTLSAQGQWSEPENLGWPINTPDDDVYFVLSASGQHGYYSSDQPGGLGGKDIYRVTFLGPEPASVAAASKAKPTGSAAAAKSASPAAKPAATAAALAHVTILKGSITDAASKKPLAATIEVIDNQKGEVVATYQSNAATGRYLLSLPSGRNYGIAVRQPGYLLYSHNVDLPAGAPYAEQQQDVALSRPAPGAIVELRNIFFDPAQAELRPESAAELARLQQLLTEQPALRLELCGQSDAASASLRQQRAEVILAYLIGHGIASSRLSTAATEQPVASLASTPQPTSGPTTFRVVAAGH
ncbi:OmpA family protein [Hymenobacter bucti]|uniref:OmpA family protein n=1 Tax=Hymenobacter bucti TaxID=1844114 RepID=A0ABW4QVV4_9BACT